MPRSSSRTARASAWLRATTDELADLLAAATGQPPWAIAQSDPAYLAAAELPAPLGAGMTALGYKDFWHVAVESSATDISYRVVACTPIHQVPATGARNRVVRAKELAAAVLYRAHTDRMLERAATHDGLTELRNRVGFSERLAELSTHDADTVALLFIDLDNFKSVNDRFGHAAGDTVLKEVANRLSDVTRSHDVVSRAGGDEFEILLSSSPDRPLDDDALRQFADRILEAVRQPIALEGVDQGVSVMASVGVAVTNDSTVDIERLRSLPTMPCTRRNAPVVIDRTS